MCICMAFFSLEGTMRKNLISKAQCCKDSASKQDFCSHIMEQHWLLPMGSIYVMRYKTWFRNAVKFEWFSWIWQETEFFMRLWLPHLESSMPSCTQKTHLLSDVNFMKNNQITFGKASFDVQAFFDILPSCLPRAPVFVPPVFSLLSPTLPILNGGGKASSQEERC